MEAMNRQLTTLTDELTLLKGELIQVKAAHAGLHQGTVDRATEAAQKFAEIKQQIEEEKMLVTVLFLGSRLAEAVEMLERSRKGSDRSYLVIHYHPSLVTVQYNLAKVYIKTFYKSRTTDSSLICCI